MSLSQPWNRNILILTRMPGDNNLTIPSSSSPIDISDMVLNIHFPKICEYRPSPSKFGMSTPKEYFIIFRFHHVQLDKKFRREFSYWYTSDIIKNTKLKNIFRV